MRPDYAPKTIIDEIYTRHPRYCMLGKVLGLGYMKGLAESIEKIVLANA